MTVHKIQLVDRGSKSPDKIASNERRKQGDLTARRFTAENTAVESQGHQKMRQRGKLKHIRHPIPFGSAVVHRPQEKPWQASIWQNGKHAGYPCPRWQRGSKSGFFKHFALDHDR